MLLYFRNLTTRKITKKFFERVASVAARAKPVLDAFEISLVLVNNEKIRDLNRQYRKVNQITDVLSFKLTDTLAEIFIAPDEALKQAKKRGHSLEKELATLFIHSLLHILGYEDDTKEKYSQMEILQEGILRQLKKADSYVFS